MFSAENAEMSYACDQQSEIDRLRELNAELLAALESVIHDLENGTTGRWEGDGSASLRAAIAKAVALV